jgi:radical SAM protein with 4Fe4S-binding SPASM domain
MKWSTILDILYHHAHKVQWVCPFGMQEPLLEPRLSAILTSIKQFNPKIATTIYTNMSIYPKKTWVELIKLQALDNVNISFYGVDKPTYELLQPPLDYYQVQRNIRKLMRLKKRMGWLKPKVSMHILVTKGTYLKANAFAAKWREVVDEVGYVHYDAWSGLAPDYDDDFETSIWGSPETQRVPCHRLWTTMMIHSDGEVVPCCLDHNAIEPCGNIKDDPHTWYNSERLNTLRQLHGEARQNEIPLCKYCTIWRREEPEQWRRNWRSIVPALAVTSPSR